MSEPPKLDRQSSESLTIPERRVVVKDPAELPSNYSETPGGTIFSTTPGGKVSLQDLCSITMYWRGCSCLACVRELVLWSCCHVREVVK